MNSSFYSDIAGRRIQLGIPEWSKFLLPLPHLPTVDLLRKLGAA